MPNKCCVYGCNSNYASTKERYSTFNTLAGTNRNTWK